jgi:hypothetical protein
VEERSDAANASSSHAAGTLSHAHFAIQASGNDKARQFLKENGYVDVGDGSAQAKYSSRACKHYRSYLDKHAPYVPAKPSGSGL